MKPCSGLTQSLTRDKVEQMAKNRGDGWHCSGIKDIALEQLLMMIELGSMNTQTNIGLGVVNISDNASYNCSALTGSTSSLGNTTGRATSTNGVSFRDFNEYDWNYAMNMIYSDYCEVLGDNVTSYVRMAHKFLNDKDAPDGKALRYAMCMKKDYK